jgi:hypothetical protein
MGDAETQAATLALLGLDPSIQWTLASSARESDEIAGAAANSSPFQRPRPQRVVGVGIGVVMAMLMAVLMAVLMIVVVVVMTVAGAGAFDVVVVAFLGQADLGFEAEDLGAVLA